MYRVLQYFSSEFVRNPGKTNWSSGQLVPSTIWKLTASQVSPASQPSRPSEPSQPSQPSPPSQPSQLGQPSSPASRPGQPSPKSPAKPCQPARQAASQPAQNCCSYPSTLGPKSGAGCRGEAVRHANRTYTIDIYLE